MAKINKATRIALVTGDMSDCMSPRGSGGEVSLAITVINGAKVNRWSLAHKCCGARYQLGPVDPLHCFVPS